LIEELLLDVFMTHINDVFKFFNASTHTQEWIYIAIFWTDSFSALSILEWIWSI
jgi:hypothetical protein